MCGRWLASNEDDGAVVRELQATTVDGDAGSPLVTYRVTTVTGDRRGAGTSANVSISNEAAGTEDCSTYGKH